LEFSYATYTLLSTVPSITSVVAPLAWGRLVDSRGNVRVLRALTWGISVIPLLWLASAAIPWIMFVQLLAGAMWAGFSLVTLNFVYGASSEADRPANIAHLFVVNGLAAAGGNLLGGVIAPLLPPVLGYNLLTLFALSGILRGMASFTLLRGVREREKESAPREPVVV
jgi:MFS family permease